MNAPKLSFRVPLETLARLREEKESRGLRSEHEAARLLLFERLHEDSPLLRRVLDQLADLADQVEQLREKVDKHRADFDQALERQ